MNSIESIQEKIVSICNELYGKSVDNCHYHIKDTTEHIVKNQILEKMDTGFKMKYLDICAYILQNGNDVFISIS